MVKGPGESFLNMVITHDEQEVAPGKRNVIASFQKLEFESFSSPYISITYLVKKKHKTDYTYQPLLIRFNCPLEDSIWAAAV